MTLYEYKCPNNCGAHCLDKRRQNTLSAMCDNCGRIVAKRVWSVSVKPMMHAHFNNTTGTPISDMKQFTAELRMQSDLASEQTGIEHNYKPLEYGDHAAFKATSEGIHESNVVRSKRGEPLLPMID